MLHSALFDEFGQGSLNRLPHHTNPGLEIVYVSEGHLTWQCEGKVEAVPANSLYFTLPWQSHGSVFDFEPHHKWHFVVIKLYPQKGAPSSDLAFSPELGLSAQETSHILQTLKGANHHSLTCSPLIACLFPELLNELQQPREFAEHRIKHLTLELIFGLVATLKNESTSTLQHLAHSQKFNHLLTLLESKYSEPWTLESMAKIVDLKRTRFNDLFKQQTGDTPLRYINRLRIQKSQNMLKDESMDITTIALNCGFASSQHYAWAFRKITGISASEYRKSGLPEVRLPRSLPDSTR